MASVTRLEQQELDELSPRKLALYQGLRQEGASHDYAIVEVWESPGSCQGYQDELSNPLGGC